VFKVGVAYVLVAFVVAQVVDIVNQPLSLPAWFDTALFVLLAAGFPIALVLAWAYELTPEGIKKTRDVPFAQHIRNLGGRRLDFAVISLLAVAVVLLVLDNYVLTGEASRDKTLAVLPFVNISSDPQQEPLADGRAHQRPGRNRRPLCQGPHVVVSLQGQERESALDRRSPQCSLRAGRQRAQGWRPIAHHGTTDRRRDRLSPVVATL
jgi:hypothetical protein